MTDFSDKLRRRFKLADAKVDAAPVPDEPPPAPEPAAPLLDDDSPLARRIAPSAAAEFLRRRLLRRQADAGTAAPSEANPPLSRERAAARDDLRQARFAAPGWFGAEVDRTGAPRARRKVALPDGEELSNARGRCFLRRLRYPLAQVHGRVALARVQEIDGARLATLAREDALAGLDLRHCLFLDTETTGLAGGAGTVVFMCGMAFVDGDALAVEQVFLRAFEDEPAALAHVAAHLLARPRLVTFTG